MIVDAWDHRISDIAKAISIFIQETEYNISYSDHNTMLTLWSMFNDPDTALLVDYTDTELNGFAIVQRTDEFHEQYFGYLSKFYILPNRRQTRSAFRLMDLVVEWFDYRDCVVSFATATAGIKNDEAFIKLLSRYRYTVSNTGMLIRKQHGKI
jgi:GNAT superfamily N-acetyltransferase